MIFGGLIGFVIGILITVYIYEKRKIQLEAAISTIERIEAEGLDFFKKV